MTDDPIRVILLNGASSSGKSTLAKALQDRLETPHLHLAEDDFWAMLPARDLPFEVRFRTYYGFMGCVAALAKAGNFVIVDTVADDAAALQEFARLLEGLGVRAVGVRCALPALEAREAARGDRSVGTARRQFATVHAHCRYDVEVDTSATDTEACIAAIVAARDAWTAPGTPLGRRGCPARTPRQARGSGTTAQLRITQPGSSIGTPSLAEGAGG